MKKIILLLSCLLFILNTRAQEFYVKGGLGYDFPQAGQGYGPNGIYSGSITSYAIGGSYYNTGTSYSFNYKRNISFSSGFDGTLGGGYMFNRHIGVELDITTGIAPKKYTASEDDGQGSTSSIIQYGKRVTLIAPQFVMQTSFKKYDLYARLGIVMPLNAHIRQDENETDVNNNNGTTTTDVYSYTVDNKTYFTVGFTAAVGAKYNLSTRISIWGEVSMMSMSLFVKEGDLLNETMNGTNVTSSVTNQTVHYSSNFTANAANSTVTEPTYSVPFSNIGLHAGIMYRFVKQKKTKHSKWH